MSEFSRPEVKGRRIVRNGLRAGVAALALTTLATAANVAPVSAAGPARQERLSEAEIAERQAARKEIKAMQRALNRRELYKGATMIDATFVVSPEFQAKTGIEVIFAPVKVGKNSYGYFEVNQETCKVIGRFIDGDMGHLEAGYGPIDGEWTPEEREVDVQVAAWGTFEPLMPGILETPVDGCVVMANDEQGSFVGQYYPYLPNRFTPPAAELV